MAIPAAATLRSTARATPAWRRTISAYAMAAWVSVPSMRRAISARCGLRATSLTRDCDAGEDTASIIPRKVDQLESICGLRRDPRRATVSGLAVRARAEFVLHLATPAFGSNEHLGTVHAACVPSEESGTFPVATPYSARIRFCADGPLGASLGPSPRIPPPPPPPLAVTVTEASTRPRSPLVKSTN